MQRTRVVVGVDGSAGSAAAVRWAAEEALLRGVELRVLTAYLRQGPTLDERTASVVHDAVMRAREAAPGVQVRGVALPGYAVPVLLHAAEDAALLVVGSRAGGGFPGTPHGSVGAQVATNAKACVVVVRGRAGAGESPVVAGVNEAPAADTIMGRAFEEAALHGAPLLAVTAQEHGGAAPADLLDTWRKKFPGVRAEHEVVAGRPDKVLVQHCRQARMVVVGPRRHGYEGVMLGPVGTRLLQHAECPVLIAR